VTLDVLLIDGLVSLVVLVIEELTALVLVLFSLENASTCYHKNPYD
jgi:hypothetical protein